MNAPTGETASVPSADPASAAAASTTLAEPVQPDDPGYPTSWEGDVVLRDGSIGHVRPITPADAEAIHRFHEGQSEESIYLRFFAPIKRLSDRDVHRYLTEHGLPYHPLRDEGYISIGDVHTSHKLTDGMSEEQTRFFGLKRECGLHEGAQSDYQI